MPDMPEPGGHTNAWPDHPSLPAAAGTHSPPGDGRRLPEGPLAPRLVFVARVPDRDACRAFFAGQCRRFGPEHVAGVISEDGAVAALSSRFLMYTPSRLRDKAGEAAWQNSIMPGLGLDAAPAVTRKPGRLGRVRSFLAAVTGPKVSEEVFRQRLIICASNACGHLRKQDDRLYCGACGCGQWRLAELHTKLWFANLECPLEKSLWGKNVQE
jgi:hypothetical protein